MSQDFGSDDGNEGYEGTEANDATLPSNEPPQDILNSLIMSDSPTLPLPAGFTPIWNAFSTPAAYHTAFPPIQLGLADPCDANDTFGTDSIQHFRQEDQVLPSLSEEAAAAANVGHTEVKTENEQESSISQLQKEATQKRASELRALLMASKNKKMLSLREGNGTAPLNNAQQNRSPDGGQLKENDGSQITPEDIDRLISDEALNQKQTHGGIPSPEDGEIQDESTLPTSVDSADQPVKSVESSLHTTTDSQEKMIRQVETSLAYQPLQRHANAGLGHTQTETKGNFRDHIHSYNKQLSTDTSKVNGKIQPPKRPDTRTHGSNPNRSDEHGDMSEHTKTTLRNQTRSEANPMQQVTMSNEKLEDRHGLRNQTVNHRSKHVQAQPHNMQTEPHDRHDDLDKFSRTEVMEWLEITGFFDPKFRSQKLDRLRKIQEMERRMTDLLREDEAESIQFTQTQLSRLSSFSPLQLSMSPRGNDNQATSNRANRMPPPPTPLSTQIGLSAADTGSAGLRSPQVITPSTKRSYAEYNDEGDAASAAKKTAQTEGKQHQGYPADDRRGSGPLGPPGSHKWEQPGSPRGREYGRPFPSDHYRPRSSSPPRRSSDYGYPSSDRFLGYGRGERRRDGADPYHGSGTGWSPRQMRDERRVSDCSGIEVSRIIW